jgi:hypothetical protein
MLEGGCGKDLGEFMRELLLIEITEEEERERFLVYCPVRVADGAFHRCV